MEEIVLRDLRNTEENQVMLAGLEKEVIVPMWDKVKTLRDEIGKEAFVELLLLFRGAFQRRIANGEPVDIWVRAPSSA